MATIQPLTRQELQCATIPNCGGLGNHDVAHQILIFNVPSKDIQLQVQDSVVQKIGHIKGFSKNAVSLLTEMLHKTHLGTYHAENAYLCKDNVYKTSIFVESLVSKDGSSVTGERFWFMVFDEKYDLDEATKDIVGQNKKHAEDGSKNDKFKDKTNKMFVDAIRQFSSYESLALSLYIPYLELLKKDINIEQLRTKFSQESFFVGERAEMNAAKIFSVKNAFDATKDWDIDPQQNQIASYFDESDVSPHKLKRRFVTPTRVMKITPEWTKLQRIVALPLPRNYFKLNETRERLDNEVENLQKTLEQMHVDNSDQEGQEDSAHHELLEILERKKNEVTEIENSHSEQMASGNPLLDGGLTDDNCKRIMKQRSVFWMLHDKNAAEISEIRQKFPVPQSKQFIDAMDAFHQKAIAECFDVLMDESIMEKTECVRTAVKWFKSLPVEEQWVENLLTCANLSPFANTMVQLMDRADKGIDHPIETNFQLFLLCFFAALTSFEFSWNLRPNLLVSGDGGTGKSHVIEAVQAIVPKGASMRFGHMTLRSQDIDIDLSQATLFCDEMPLHFLGVDPQGRPIAADGPFKDRIAKQYSSTLSFRRDEATGRRMADLQVSRQMQTLIFANNNPCPPAESALMQRFVPIYVNKLYRQDREPNSSIYRTQHNEILELQREITRYLQLHCTYQLFYNVFIEAGALPPIDNQSLVLLSKWVFERLAVHKVPELSARRMDQMKMLCNQVHMFHAINAEFFSEVGLSHRRRNGKPKPFEAKDMMGLLKHGAVFQEEAAFSMTLLENVLVPKFKNQVCQVFIKDFCHVEDASSIPTSAFFRKKVREEKDGNDRTVFDYNYVSIEGTSYAQIYQRFSKTVEGRPSQNVVNNILNDMRNEYIEVYIREKTDVGQETRITINADKLKTSEKYPVVIFDTDPFCKTNKRISILIDALPTMTIHNYQNLLHDAIQDSLSFNHQLNTSIITASPYVRLAKKDRNQPENADKNLKPECFPSLLSLIPIKRRANEKRYLENPYALTLVDFISLFNRVGNKYGSSLRSIDRFSTEPISVFDMYLDDYFFYSYCIRAGIDPAQNKSVLPIEHKNLCMGIRRTNPYFKDANLRWISNYPLDNVSWMDRMAEKRLNKGSVIQTVSRICTMRDGDDLYEDDFELFNAFPEMYTKDPLSNNANATTNRIYPTQPLSYHNKDLIEAYNNYNEGRSESEQFTIEEVMTNLIFGQENNTKVNTNQMLFVQDSPEEVQKYIQKTGHLEIHEYTEHIRKQNKLKESSSSNHNNHNNYLANNPNTNSGMLVSSEVVVSSDRTEFPSQSPRSSQTNSPHRSPQNNFADFDFRGRSPPRSQGSQTRPATNFSGTANMSTVTATTTTKKTKNNKDVSNSQNPPAVAIERKRKFTQSAFSNIRLSDKNREYLEDLYRTCSNHSQDALLPPGSKSTSPTVSNLSRPLPESNDAPTTTFKLPKNPKQSNNVNDLMQVVPEAPRPARDDEEDSSYDYYNAKKPKKTVYHKHKQ